ncbi:MAG: Type site-specific deoxyribonuclease [Bacteroidota bacterium]|jgi:hypothetical protein
MNESEYQLVKGKNRFIAKECPCGKNNKDGKFVPFMGFEKFGYCHSCDKTIFPPIENNESKQQIEPQPKVKKVIPPTTFIPLEMVKTTLANTNQNNFISFLINKFGETATKNLIDRYKIGTSNRWNGATVFWQIDHEGKVRTGKIILYDAITGKRIKEPFNHVYWMHNSIQEFHLKQCFFGEHLLRDKVKPVAIVESEKTAIICSYFNPKLIWLATGGKTQLKPNKFDVLKGRKVFLFPDLNAFEDWNDFKTKVTGLNGLIVSDLLEKKATQQQRKDGLDLADYLLFNFKPHPKETAPLNLENQKLVPICSRVDEVQTWTNEIIELEKYFSQISIPQQPIKLNQCSIISDCSLFIATHLSTVKANNGKRKFSPYLQRLLDLKTILSKVD